MQAISRLMVVLVLVTLIGVQGTALLAQDDEEDAEDKIGWSNMTDLSLVVTEGNSNTETFGFANRLRRNWEKARFTLRLESVRSNTADDTFARVGGDPENPGDIVISEALTHSDGSLNDWLELHNTTDRDADISESGICHLRDAPVIEPNGLGQLADLIQEGLD